MQHSGLQGSVVVLTKPDSPFLISSLRNRNRCTCLQNYGSLWFTQSPLNNKVRYFIVQITIFVTSFTFYFAVEETMSKDMIFPCSHAFCPFYFTNFQETTGRRKRIYIVLSSSEKKENAFRYSQDLRSQQNSIISLLFITVMLEMWTETVCLRKWQRIMFNSNLPEKFTDMWLEDNQFFSVSCPKDILDLQ